MYVSSTTHLGLLTNTFIFLVILRNVTQHCHKWCSLKEFIIVLRKYARICKPVV